MKPLCGAQVLVTRPQHQAEELCRLIAGQGGVAVRLPTLAIVPVADSDSVKAKLAALGRYDWLVFVSANAVTMLQLLLYDGRMPPTSKTRIAAIGASTARALRQAGWPVTAQPEHGFDSEALLATAAMQQVAGLSVLIVRGVGGREQLTATLRVRGAQVDVLEVYQRAIPAVDTAELQSLLNEGRLNAVTITSGEALQNLLAMLDQQYHQPLFAIPVIVISDRIGRIAKEIGFTRIAVAQSPADAAIVESVITCLTGK